MTEKKSAKRPPAVGDTIAITGDVDEEVTVRLIEGVGLSRTDLGVVMTIGKTLEHPVYARPKRDGSWVLIWRVTRARAVNVAK